jgi:hypothetical protein
MKLASFRLSILILWIFPTPGAWSQSVGSDCSVPPGKSEEDLCPTNINTYRAQFKEKVSLACADSAIDVEIKQIKLADYMKKHAEYQDEYVANFAQGQSLGRFAKNSRQCGICADYDRLSSSNVDFSVKAECAHRKMKSMEKMTNSYRND